MTCSCDYKCSGVDTYLTIISVTGDSLSTVEVYDPIVGRWQLAEAMTMLRSRVGVAVMRNRLYAFGGYNGSERLSTVEVFDPQKRAWSRVSPMQCKRRLVHIISTFKLHWFLVNLKSSKLYLVLWQWTHLRILLCTLYCNCGLRKKLQQMGWNQYTAIIMLVTIW